MLFVGDLVCGIERKYVGMRNRLVLEFRFCSVFWIRDVDLELIQHGSTSNYYVNS